MFFLFGSSFLRKLKLYYSSAEIKAGAAGAGGLIRCDVLLVQPVNEGFLDYLSSSERLCSALSGSLSVRAARLLVYEGCVCCGMQQRGERASLSPAADLSMWL